MFLHEKENTYSYFNISTIFVLVFRIYFLLDRGGLSEKALVPILCTFVIFLIVILVPNLVYSLIQIRKGFTPKNMLISGIVMFGTMIPIWIMSIIVSIAMVTTILLSVLVPVILFIDCAFAT